MFLEASFLWRGVELWYYLAMDEQELNASADFLFEMGMLAKTPRSGFFFLGSGEQSVAEHLNRATYIGFVLASMAGDVDRAKVLQMAAFHDIAEARVSDLNYVHQKYTTRNEEKAVQDLAASFPFGKDIADLIEEYERRESREARLAKDADNLELLLALKEQVDIGNQRAQSWIPALVKRLLAPEAQRLAEAIMRTDSDHWWFGDKNDGWWVHRDKTA